MVSQMVILTEASCALMFFWNNAAPVDMKKWRDWVQKVGD